MQWKFVELGLKRARGEVRTGVRLLEVTAVEMALDYTKEYGWFELCSPESEEVAKEFLVGMAGMSACVSG